MSFKYHATLALVSLAFLGCGRKDEATVLEEKDVVVAGSIGGAFKLNINQMDSTGLTAVSSETYGDSESFFTSEESKLPDRLVKAKLISSTSDFTVKFDAQVGYFDLSENMQVILEPNARTGAILSPGYVSNRTFKISVPKEALADSYSIKAIKRIGVIITNTKTNEARKVCYNFSATSSASLAELKASLVLRDFQITLTSYQCTQPSSSGSVLPLPSPSPVPSASVPTTASEIVSAPHPVIATPAPDFSAYSVVESIKLSAEDYPKLARESMPVFTTHGNQIYATDENQSYIYTVGRDLTTYDSHHSYTQNTFYLDNLQLPRPSFTSVPTFSNPNVSSDTPEEHLATGYQFLLHFPNTKEKDKSFSLVSFKPDRTVEDAISGEYIRWFPNIKRAYLVANGKGKVIDTDNNLFTLLPGDYPYVKDIFTDGSSFTAFTGSQLISFTLKDPNPKVLIDNLTKNITLTSLTTFLYDVSSTTKTFYSLTK